MPDITPLVPAGRQVIQSYGGGRFRINGEEWRGSVIVLAERTVAWPVADIATLTAAAFIPIERSAVPIEILLLGCGARAAMVDRALRDALRARGIVVEAMDTGAACRTFNVLMAEDRAVAAALIAVV